MTLKTKKNKNKKNNRALRACRLKIRDIVIHNNQVLRNISTLPWHDKNNTLLKQAIWN